MSEVTKKSDTSSSQMRLLGGTPHMCNCEMCVKLTRFGHLNLVDSWTIFMILDENEKIVKILFKCFSFNLLNEVSKYLRVCIFSWEIET